MYGIYCSKADEFSRVHAFHGCKHLLCGCFFQKLTVSWNCPLNTCPSLWTTSHMVRLKIWQYLKTIGYSRETMRVCSLRRKGNGRDSCRGWESRYHLPESTGWELAHCRGVSWFERRPSEAGDTWGYHLSYFIKIHTMMTWCMSSREESGMYQRGVSLPARNGELWVTTFLEAPTFDPPMQAARLVNSGQRMIWMLERNPMITPKDHYSLHDILSSRVTTGWGLMNLSEIHRRPSNKHHLMISCRCAIAQFTATWGHFQFLSVAIWNQICKVGLGTIFSWPEEELALIINPHYTSSHTLLSLQPPSLEMFFVGFGNGPVKPRHWESTSWTNSNVVDHWHRTRCKGGLGDPIHTRNLVQLPPLLEWLFVLFLPRDAQNKICAIRSNWLYRHGGWLFVVSTVAMVRCSLWFCYYLGGRCTNGVIRGVCC